MLIVCPACASEYKIDPVRIGADGRPVRCAECRETWFVVPDPDIEAEFGFPARTLPSEISRGDIGYPENALEAIPPPPVPSRAAPSPASQRDDWPEPAKAAGAPGPTFLARHKLALVSGLWVVLLVGAFAGRTSIVRLFPQTAWPYAAIGLPVNLRGLDLRDVRAEMASAETGAFLVVEGEIANAKSGTTAVPPLELAVQGQNGQPIYTWTSEAPQPTLGAAEAMRFRARLASPPAEGRRVSVKFASGEGG